MAQRGLLDLEQEDPFSLFVTSTDIRYCYYHDTHKILGNTFGMCMCPVLHFLHHFNPTVKPTPGGLGRAQSRHSTSPSSTTNLRTTQCCERQVCMQDFEALTPNLLARTIESVAGGGIVVLLLGTLTSLMQLFSLTVDVHSRLRTESHQDVTGEPFQHPLQHYPMSLWPCDHDRVIKIWFSTCVNEGLQSYASSHKKTHVCLNHTALHPCATLAVLATLTSAQYYLLACAPTRSTSISRWQNVYSPTTKYLAA